MNGYFGLICFNFVRKIQILSKVDLLLDDFERSLLMLDREEAERIFLLAATEGSTMEISTDLMVKGLERIGKGWEQGVVTLSQVYMSGMICEALIDRIIPLQSPERKSQPVIGIAVFEDFHLLGKRIIYSFLRASGFELIDLGSGLNSDDLIRQVDRHQVRILLLSVLMLPSALHVKELAVKLKEQGVKLVVGGAPFRFDENLWKEVGADATGKNPAEALGIITKMIAEAQ